MARGGLGEYMGTISCAMCSDSPDLGEIERYFSEGSAKARRSTVPGAVF